jgi:hypothetical protein
VGQTRLVRDCDERHRAEVHRLQHRLDAEHAVEQEVAAFVEAKAGGTTEEEANDAPIGRRRRVVAAARRPVLCACLRHAHCNEREREGQRNQPVKGPLRASPSWKRRPVL